MNNQLKELLQKMDKSQLIECILSINNNSPKNVRENSLIYSLRKFHNNIKSTLITNIKKYYSIETNLNKFSLLDIAVGRGGDLKKWEFAKINNVTGFDASYESIYSTDPNNPGAIERLKNNKLNKNFKVKYFVGDATSGTIKFPYQFDFVSCQFALHYFFKDEKSIRNVLKLVSNSLKKGGYFYGTTVDSERLLKLLGNNQKIENKYYTIEKKFKKNESNPFGKEYLFKLNDTIYFDSLEEYSKEYLVNFDLLNKLASEYSLKPVYIDFFNDFFMTSSWAIAFNDLLEYPSFQKYKLSKEELEITSLYKLFVFKKY